MESYKIRVNNEAESKDAQELFFELGYAWPSTGKRVQSKFLFLIACSDGDLNWNTRSQFGTDDSKELTMPQLRDLVVLKRNDVKDATHKNFRTNTPYLKQGENEYYMFNGEWVLSNCPNDLEPITKPQDPALISGAEALRALADGVKPEEIEGKFSSGIETYFLSMGGKVDVFLKVVLNKKLFRLKPQTIKLELELPKPFEPKEDCHVYILDDGKTDGYRRYSYEVHGDKGNEFIGIWKTEDEIKQVVEQLRKIKGAV
ncbi:hypothetical protein A323_gp84 [Acinetobacter phage AP22]|uniref:Uncharacterized protein n=1 Tax=Acinetobacter phage AP22 TaxID=1187128 RepID=I2GUJ1_9CAUD|nr:hypothetical protein A323_gp84 [Acinetobacter phage AP22]CCH57792.1 hypothetical protein [Acinetobacter phage AP22]